MKLQRTLNQFSVNVSIGSGGETFQNHHSRNKEKLFADVEHVLGCAGRYEVNNVFDRCQVSLSTIDLRSRGKYNFISFLV